MPVLALSLPAVFIALAAVMLLLGMAALWQSLRSAFGGGPPEDLRGFGGFGEERSALLAEKKTLLRAIKDIQFEREVGKISDEDFARLDKAYRRRAKEVLRLLDQDLGEFLTKAERLVGDAMGEEDGSAYRQGKVKRRKRRGPKGKGPKGTRRRSKAKDTIECPACGATNDFDATFCKECATRLAPVDCPSCGTPNDPDAKFCKSCAKPLGEQPEARAGARAGGGAASAGGASGVAAAAAVASSSSSDGSDTEEASDDRADAEEADAVEADAEEADAEEAMAADGDEDAAADPDDDSDAKDEEE